MEDFNLYVTVGSAIVLSASMVYIAAKETNKTERFIESINDFYNKKYKAK